LSNIAFGLKKQSRKGLHSEAVDFMESSEATTILFGLDTPVSAMYPLATITPILFSAALSQGHGVRRLCTFSTEKHVLIKAFHYTEYWHGRYLV